MWTVSEVTSHLCLCSGHPIKIIPARRPSPAALMFHLVVPADRSRGLFILRAVPGSGWCEQTGQQQVAPVPGGAHSKSACVAKTPQVFDVGPPR